MNTTASHPSEPLRFTLRHGEAHGFALARLVEPSALLLEAFPLPPRGAEITLTPRLGGLPGVLSLRCEVHAVRTATTLERPAAPSGLAALDVRGPGLVVIIRAVDLATDDVAAAQQALAQLGVATPLPPALLMPVPDADGGDHLRALPAPPTALARLAEALGRDEDAHRGAGLRDEFGLDDETPLGAATGDEARARLLLATDETPLPLQAPSDSDEDAFGPRRRGLTGFLSTLLRRGRTSGTR